MERLDIKKIIDKKEFHIAVITIIIVIIIFSAVLIMIKYNEEGETNLPFNISKITVISSIEGTDNEDSENKWNLSVNQNNDIYIYIDKNDSYKDTSVLEKITLENFKIQPNTSQGIKELFKPDSVAENVIFRNVEENKVDNLEYIGSEQNNIKECKISNQGGVIVFRYANKNIGQYVSNEDEEINHNDLLKKIDANQENLSFDVNFDLLMNVQGGTVYKANLNFKLPVGDIVNNGTQSEEITELDSVVFRRE